jgi:biopolymer transport protein ExbB
MENAVAELSYYLNQGGFVMWPLVIATLFLWYGLGYRIATLRRGDRLSVRALIERHRAGYEREPSGIVDTAVVRGLEIAGKGRVNLRRLLDDSFSDLVEAIGKHAVLVRSIVIIAPLAGLLGTVTGMIETFDSLGEATLYSQSGGIAGGIGEALISTQMGLAVAVPGMIVGRILERRQKMMARELDQIKDVLCSEEGKGPEKA